MISMIVAMDKNRAIGKSNTLPWHVPEDLSFFRKVTRDKVVVMGEKTYQSIGRPLSNRRNIVVSRNKDLKIEGVDIFNSVNEVIHLSKLKEIFIIGGGQIYKHFLPYTDNLYITQLDLELKEADTFFPPYEECFNCIIRGEENYSETQGINYRFTLWKKNKGY